MKALALLLLAVAAGAAFAQPTPVGLWKTIDDQTGKEKSYVRIVEANGVLSGRVEKIVDPAKADAKCDQCSDDRKGQPIVGMTIIRNLRKQADDLWEGGDILDPNNGKVYQLRLRLEDGGKQLGVRGYIGLPLLGRSQTWLRAE